MKVPNPFEQRYGSQVGAPSSRVVGGSVRGTSKGSSARLNTLGAKDERLAARSTTATPPTRLPLRRVASGWQTPSVVRSMYTIDRLDARTWESFVDLVERNNGIYGGCWCAPNHVEYQRGVSVPRTVKEQLVMNGRAHASLVVDQDGLAQGWCQYGPANSLHLKHARAYAKDPPLPAQWRIACIFVDRRHRGQGVARAALTGALDQIADAGGGRVESISETTLGREAQGRFLFSATVELFEELGFSRVRQVGKHAWIVTRSVEAPAT